MNQYIDVIYYINLDHRTDRNAEFLDEMRKMEIDPEKIVRIPGIRRDHGDVGCSLSHAKTIETFLASSHENCIIFEDDFMFMHDSLIINDMVTQFFSNKIEYDVCNLSTDSVPSTKDHPNHSFIKQVIFARTTSGYMLSKQFAPVLLDNVKEGAHLLQTECYDKNNIPLKFVYTIDSYWKNLQLISRWFMFWPKMGRQRPSWSDIENSFGDYGT